MSEPAYLTERISTHALTRGATHLVTELGQVFVNFYSRPYARDDPHQKVLRRRSLISTHAPTRGATCPCCFSGPSLVQFLLTPLREGQRRGIMRRCRPAPHFYSRPYARGDWRCIGCDYGDWCYFYSRPYARGDRSLAAVRCQSFAYFYSRPYARGDAHRQC